MHLSSENLELSLQLIRPLYSESVGLIDVRYLLFALNYDLIQLSLGIFNFVRHHFDRVLLIAENTLHLVFKVGELSHVLFSVRMYFLLKDFDSKFLSGNILVFQNPVLSDHLADLLDAG